MYMKKQLEKTGKLIKNIIRKKNESIIIFNDEKIALNNKTIEEFNLFNNKTINNETLIKIKQFNEFINGLDYSLKLINKYVYTRKNLINKLAKRNINKNCIDKIMEYLINNKLINDEEFAKEYFLEQINKFKGPYYIKNKLIEKGIDSSLINDLIDNYDKKIIEDLLNKKITILVKKYHNKKCSNIKNKVISNCLSNGYSITDINKVINRFNIKENDDLSNLKILYLKYRNRIEDKNKIVKILKSKGYSYSKIKVVMEETDNDLY